MRNPIGSTGWVIADDAQGHPRFVGTCFGFRRAHFLLTAAHCVKGYARRALSVSILGDRVERGISVKRVDIHPTADVALLEVSDVVPVFDFFRDVGADYPWGAPVTAFGYPEDSGETGIEPTPRFFRGHIQRLFRHTSHLGYRYAAMELSFGAPGGLSGGPVALESKPSEVLGVVAENLRSSTWLETVESVTEGNTEYRSEVHSVINYGLAVSLGPCMDWLNDVAPLQ